MDVRRAAWLVAAGRAALGTAILLAPERVTAAWLGPAATTPPVPHLARMLGARDLALGLAALRTLDDRRAAPLVQGACALADAVDTVATIAARRQLPRSGVLGTAAVAGGAAVACLYFAASLPE